MNNIYLKGVAFDVQLSFPWERGIFILIELVKDGGVIERWEKEIPKGVFQQYRLYIPLIKKYIESML
jgi:hypothetical protein